MNASNSPPQNGNACNCINLLYLLTMFVGAWAGWKIGVGFHWSLGIVGIVVGGALGWAVGLGLLLLALLIVSAAAKFDRWRDRNSS